MPLDPVKVVVFGRRQSTVVVCRVRRPLRSMVRGS